MSCIPITLVGDNLGLRHRHLNALVAESNEKGVPFTEIQDLPEKTPVDRLFKIDLASKLRNVDYILQNIKDEDMLYVSRALKAKWMLDEEYYDFINPKYLENNLYPYMVTPAVSKVKNWLYLNLKDAPRCEEFYKFYSDKNFDYAIKFLGNCSVDFILNEAPKILEKISLHYFKVLCEKCPQVAKIYFDSIPKNDKLRMKLVDNQLEFFNNLKVVLKLNADIFFEITEKYYINIRYGRVLTKYIMTSHRDKFERKPELYAGILLNMQTVAKCLNTEECKDLVLKLARASYISYRFDYKFVEPLIKRIPVAERAAFKKQIFVEKNVGQLVETWPYEIPTMPHRNDYEIHVFEDQENPKFEYAELSFRTMLKKRKYAKYQANFEYCTESCRPVRTYLDQLFDEYRFVGFERTLYELRKKIKEDSSSQNRQYMMLVLVSKSGGKPELVASLLELLEQHLNEPVHVRATVVRSLVKRAAVWRLPQHSWEALMQFARGLGLDGSTPEADCREGLHAVVIRSLLDAGTCEPAIRDAFLQDFSHLDEYSTDANERKIVREKLPLLLLSAADAEVSLERQVELLSLLFNMLKKYKMNIESSPLVPAVAALAKRDACAAESLLRQLYHGKIARRTLFHENFPLFQTDASYLNALRHDTSVLNVTKFVDLIESNEIRPEQFLRKISVYFAESLGMMEIYRTELRERVLTNPSIERSVARPLGLLQGACLSYLETLDVKNATIARLASAIKANMHAGRPKLNIDKINMPAAGAKAVANKVLVCPSAEVDQYIPLLLNWKRTIRVALALAERTGKEADVYVAAAALRPTATLKAALKYLRRRGADFDPRVWDLFKQLMNDYNLCTEKHVHVRESLKKLDEIPTTIKPAYCAILFKALKTDYYYDALSILSDMEDYLPNVDDNFLEQQLLHFLAGFKYDEEQQKNKRAVQLYLRLITKFLMLCQSEEAQKKRIETFREPLFKCLAQILNKSEKDFLEIFDAILLCLQYNKIFFDDSYVSPLPVLENIITWMRQCLPIEIHFNKYVCIHLTMLYLKAVRISIKSQPAIFKDEKRKLSEGISIVGNIFGEKIAREIKQLTENYFESAIELYRAGIHDYFSDYFQYDVTKFKFIKAIVQGILQVSTGDELRAALYILTDEICNFSTPDIQELIDGMKIIENEKFKYFFHAEMSKFRDYLAIC